MFSLSTSACVCLQTASDGLYASGAISRARGVSDGRAGDGVTAEVVCSLTDTHSCVYVFA